MACISDGDMTLSIRHVGYRPREEVIEYELLVTMDGRPLVNPDVTVWKSDPSSRYSWDRMPPGALFCVGDPPCDFLTLFEGAVATNRGQFRWFSADEVEIALYPDFVLPVEPMVGRGDWDACKAREEARVAKPACPDDVWELHMTFGWPQLRNRQPSGSLMVQMLVDRSEIDDFVRELRQEYVRFSKAFGVPGESPT